MTTNLKIIIVDRDSDKLRANNNAQAFLSLIKTKVYIVLNDSIKLAEKGTNIEDFNDIEDFTVDSYFFLAIVHNNDYTKWYTLCSSKKELCNSSFVIRYTGDYQQSWHKEDQEWITRSINSNTAITLEEAREIINYIQCCQEKGKKICPKPKILTKPSSPLYLPTLSILCQGYLIAHCNLQTRKPNFDENKYPEAYSVCSQMLETLPSINTLQIANNAQQEVNNIKWWELIQNKQDVITKEWGENQEKGFDYVNKLLETIQKNQIDEETIKVVVNAYVAVTKRLNNNL